MWCRAEVFSFYCRRGLEDLYIADKQEDQQDDQQEDQQGDEVNMQADVDQQVAASYHLFNMQEDQVDDIILVFVKGIARAARGGTKG